LSQGLLLAAWSHLPPSLQQKIPAPPVKDGDLYERVAAELDRLGSSVAPMLITALWIANADVRLASLLALRHFDPSSTAAVSNIVGLLQDTNCEIRVEAAVIVTRLRPEEVSALPVLGQALTPKRGPPKVSLHARLHAVEAFGRLDARHADLACRHLTDGREDPESSVRVAACEALWRINHDDSVVPQLCQQLATALRFLEPNDVTKSITITELLGKIGPTPNLTGAALLQMLAPHLSWGGGLSPYSARLVNAVRRIDQEVSLDLDVQEPRWLVRAPVTVQVGKGYWVFENREVELDPVPGAASRKVHDRPT
jgi:hypothetical protein